MNDPKSTAFLDAIKASEIGAKIAADIDTRRTAERQKIADELARLNAEVERDHPKKIAAVERAALAVKKAEQALAEARVKLMHANGARIGGSAAYTITRGDLEYQLAESASPLISDFAAWCRDDLDVTRKKFASRSWQDVNEVTGKAFARSVSNSKSIAARTAALFAAIASAEELKLIPDQSGVAEAIGKIKASIPEVEVDPK
jgi:hypothetical protein